MAVALEHHFGSLPISCSSFRRQNERSTCIRKGINLVKKYGTGFSSFSVQYCSANTAKIVSNKENDNDIARRSANYQPPLWDFDYIQSLRSKYAGEVYATQVSKLKGDLRVMLEKEADPLAQLEHIDMLQRLGISYHFENEIKSILSKIHSHRFNSLKCEKSNLYATALQFRLFRQHGHCAAPGVLNAFKDDTGNFKACVRDDVMGMLSLYEASFHLLESESVLEEAREFTSKHLKEYIKGKKTTRDDYLYVLVSHALELPLHWRMLRSEARWFIDVFEKRPHFNPAMLELAKLDFNVVQSTHQEDLKYSSMWWKNSCLGEESLKFARDRLMVHFLWTVGEVFEPQFGYCRRMLTEVNALVTLIDDIYDVYGTLDELELFTGAVKRWDMNAKDQLPDYMKTCFPVLHDSINRMAIDVLKEQGFFVLKYLKNAWADLCESFLVEAKWYHNGYKPTMQEYIENAWVSASAPVILVHAYFFVTKAITEEALENLEKYPSIIRQSSMILRLANDLGTSSDEMKRGDVPKSIQCYMDEEGVSEDEARKHIEFLIDETWKQLNKDRLTNSPFSKTFVEIATNLARVAQFMYQHGDGYGVQDHETKDRVLFLLVNPIPLPPFRHEP